jgi:hypothetical protein
MAEWEKGRMGEFEFRGGVFEDELCSSPLFQISFVTSFEKV